MSAARLLRDAAGLAAACQWGPAVTSLAPLRRRLLPSLAGLGRSDGVALTYDDGPDPASTPHFLALLDRHRVTATFFLLGAYVEANRSLVAEMTAGGHELAVHGWDHTCLAWKRPGLLAEELLRARAVVEDAGGRPVRFYRPPYGVQTGEGVLAARGAGLRTVLWSAWGRDWTARATPERIAATLDRALRPGGTILLHDTDRTSAPGSWRRTLAASDLLLDQCADRGWRPRPLADHLGVRLGGPAAPGLPIIGR